ncbi:MAG: hypothetical protein AAF211_20290, partial [Myxococcota bacterium]
MSSMRTTLHVLLVVMAAGCGRGGDRPGTTMASDTEFSVTEDSGPSPSAVEPTPVPVEPPPPPFTDRCADAVEIADGRYDVPIGRFTDDVDFSLGAAAELPAAPDAFGTFTVEPGEALTIGAGFPFDNRLALFRLDACGQVQSEKPDPYTFVNPTDAPFTLLLGLEATRWAGAGAVVRVERRPATLDVLANTVADARGLAAAPGQERYWFAEWGTDETGCEEGTHPGGLFPIVVEPGEQATLTGGLSTRFATLDGPECRLADTTRWLNTADVPVRRYVHTRMPSQAATSVTIERTRPVIDRLVEVSCEAALLADGLGAGRHAVGFDGALAPLTVPGLPEGWVGEVYLPIDVPPHTERRFVTGDGPLALWAGDCAAPGGPGARGPFSELGALAWYNPSDQVVRKVAILALTEPLRAVYDFVVVDRPASPLPVPDSCDDAAEATPLHLPGSYTLDLSSADRSVTRDPRCWGAETEPFTPDVVLPVEVPPLTRLVVDQRPVATLGMLGQSWLALELMGSCDDPTSCVDFQVREAGAVDYVNDTTSPVRLDLVVSALQGVGSVTIEIRHERPDSFVSDVDTCDPTVALTVGVAAGTFDGAEDAFVPPPQCPSGSGPDRTVPVVLGPSERLDVEARGVERLY